MTSTTDEAQIRALYAAYNDAIDAGKADDWADTFVMDGVFRHPLRDWAGRAELRQFVTERWEKIADGPIREQRHWNDAVQLDVFGDTARGHCDLLVSGIDSSVSRAVVVAQGRYSDRLVRTPLGWRFTERHLIVS